MQLVPPEPREEPDNILPLINVVFLLLIFFMMVGALHAIDAFDVQPPTSASEQGVEDGEMVVLIGEDGRLALGEKEVDDLDLQLGISDLLAERPSAVIRIKADGRVEAVRVIEVMEMLEAVGIQRVILLTLEPEA